MPDDGFKMGDAYVEVHIDVDKPVKEAAKKIEKSGADLKKSGKKAGKDTGEGIIKGTLEGMDAGDGDVVKKSGEIGKKSGKETAEKAQKEIERQKPKITKAGMAMFGGLPAVAAVSGAATVGALAGIPLIFGGIAAAALSSNQDVQSSFHDLRDTVVNDVHSMASPLADDFVGVAQDAQAAWKRSGPVLTSIFSDLDDSIHQVSNGAIGLVENALPGMATAASHSRAEFAGLNSLLKDTGSGVSDFFTNTSKGSAGAAQVITTFGGVIQHVLGFVGNLVAKITTYGAGSFDTFAEALNNTEDAVLGLAQGALPVLGAYVTTTLGAFSSLLRVLGPISPALGEIATTGLVAKTAFGALNLVSFGKLQQSLDRVKVSVKDASGFSGKAKAAFAGLGSAAGLAGLTAVGFGVAMDIVGVIQQKAAERAQRLSDATDVLTKAMEDGAAVGSGSYLAALTKVGSKIPGLSAQLQAANSNLATAADTAIAGGDAWDQYREKTTAVGNGMIFTGVQGEILGTKMDELRQAQLNAARANTVHELALRGLATTGLAPLDELLVSMAQGLGDVDTKTIAAHSSTEQLKGAMQTLASSTAAVDDKVTALTTAMDIFTGRQPSVEEATQAINADMRKLAETTGEWTANVEGSQIQIDRHGMSLRAWAASLINADGTINTTTESGSQFQDMLVQTQTDLYNQVTAMHAAGASHADLTKKVQTTRDAFIQQAQKMGFTKQQAIELANKYGLIPDKVATTVEGHVQGALNAIGSVTKSLNDISGKKVDVYIAAHRIGDFSLPHNAEGTDYWRGGLTTLAEEGSELIRTPGNGWSLAAGPMVADLPTGSQVLPHNDTVRALAGVGASPGMAPMSIPTQRGGDGSAAPVIIHNNFVVDQYTDIDALANKVSSVVERNMRRGKK